MCRLFLLRLAITTFAFAVSIAAARAWGSIGVRDAELMYRSYDEQVTRVYLAAMTRGLVTELRLPIPSTSHEWSPDGTRLVFVSPHDGDPDLYVVDADGRNLRALTDNAIPDYSPAWSPDGTQIAYASVGYVGRGATDIYALSVDGSTPPRNISGFFGSASMPRWSPDGREIAYMYAERGVRTTYRAPADGSAAASPSGKGQPAAPDFPMVSEWAWSPDGTRALFVAIDIAPSLSASQQLVLTDADDPAAWRLLPDGADRANAYDMPVWSPDGTQIAYVAVPRVTSDIFIVDADRDSPPRRLSPLPSNDRYPAWSADGRWIAFTSGDNQFSEIYAVEWASGRLVRVTRDRVGDFAPSWRP
jgi:TolB protein